MINNIEIEYKLLVSKDNFEKLSNLYPNKEFIKQINTYYDTPNNDLKIKHCAMRIREKDGKFMITLKIPSVLGHEEYECYVNENSINAINNSEVRKILDKLGISNEIVVLGECTTYRAIVETEKAELCFDINEYNQITDYEIEYEQTCDHDGVSEFNRILSQVGLVYTKNCASKIKRTLDTK